MRGALLDLVRTRPLVAATALCGIVAAAAGGELAGGALRALGLVALLGAAGAAISGRRRGTSPPALVRLEERHLLTREAGVAVVEAGGRRLLVGFGPSGVELLMPLRAGVPLPPSGRGRAGWSEEEENGP